MAGLLGRLFRRQRTPELRCSAVVPAAGSSTRMEGQDKLLLPLEEQPVLLHTLRALELCPYLAEIIVVTREDLIVPIGQLCRDAWPGLGSSPPARSWWPSMTGPAPWSARRCWRR